ncbi:hypothetical protein RR42_s3370 [Cupriavidus basilensis]|uniref:Uncharacterized protein n=1 Tax=Cupriavidus basilensis TaxID=68895 RepID=A0A0C4YWT0_9BURK|nr:hypothetical protein RR42_s3370 [Cupriavidus basilensis]
MIGHEVGCPGRITGLKQLLSPPARAFQHCQIAMSALPFAHLNTQPPKQSFYERQGLNMLSGVYASCDCPLQVIDEGWRGFL